MYAPFALRSQSKEIDYLKQIKKRKRVQNMVAL